MTGQPASQSDASLKPQDLDAAIMRAADFLVSTQNPDGSWDGDYGGPCFLLPMYVAAHHACARPISAVQGEGMVRYILSTQTLMAASVFMPKPTRV